MTGKWWSSYEDEYIKKHYYTKNIDEISEHIGRSVNAIKHRAFRIGVSGVGKRREKQVYNKYTIIGDSTYIHLTHKGKPCDCIIDTDDLEKIINMGKICIDVMGYCFISVPPKKKKIHRVVMGYDGELFIDHINGNTLDNRKCNLRIATVQQNSQNQHRLHPRNTSGYRNVTWSNTYKCWRVIICVNGKRLSKHMHNKEDAIALAKEWRKKYMPFSTV
jgi:hypothetical protein